MLSILCVTLALFLIIWGFGAGEKTSPPAAVPRALLLVENDTGTYLMQLRKGLQEAVQERNGQLSVERLPGPGSEAALTIDPGLTVIYLLSDQPAGYLDVLHKTGCPVVVLGQEIRGETCVIPDEEGGGRLAGEYLSQFLQNSALSIVTDNNDSLSSLRLKGLISSLGSGKYRTYAYEEFDKDKLNKSSPVAALSQQALLKVLSLRQMDGPAIYGFDGEDNRLKLMEEGSLSGIVTDNPYALGYIAGNLLNDIHLGEFKPSLHYGPMHLVTLKTLYNADNVKLMFPLLH